MQISTQEDKISNAIRSMPELLDKVSEMIATHKENKAAKTADTPAAE